MKITIYTDMSEYEAERPITERRGFKGFPYAIVEDGEYIREFTELSSMGNLFHTLAGLIEENANEGIKRDTNDTRPITTIQTTRKRD